MVDNDVYGQGVVSGWLIMGLDGGESSLVVVKIVPP